MAKRPRDLKGYVLFKILTKGIYTTFTRAIKEAVSNAYDAGANEVQIDFDPPKFLKSQEPSELSIQIRDDGMGMSLDDFWSGFASIESEKDSTKKDSITGRYPIGQFGIGSFALVPFSLTMTLYSKKARHKPIKCVINAAALQKKTGENFPDHVRKSIKDEEITDDQWQTIFGSKDSGTVIYLRGVTHETYAELRDGTGRFDGNEKGLFPDAPFTTGLREIAWELSTVLPLNYADDPGQAYQNHKTSLSSPNDGIRITLDEIELTRQIYSAAKSMVRTIDYNEGGVRAKGVLVAVPANVVQPRDANGVILRLNNVGIGGYSLFNVVGQPMIRQRVTGEVQITRGLHEALNAARDRFSGEAFDKLKVHLHGELTDLLRDAYALWQRRKDTKARRTEQSTAEKHKELHDSARKPKASAAKAQSSRKSDVKTARESDKSSESGAARKKTFSDPVIDIRSTGEMRVDESHDLFRKFKGKSEKQAVKLFLRAMRIAALPDTTYQRVIDALMDLK